MTLSDQTAQRRAHDHFTPGVDTVTLNLSLQQVGGAEQTCHENVHRPVVKFPRRPNLDDPSQIDDSQPVRQGECFGAVVGQNQRRHLSFHMNSSQVVPKLVTRSIVEQTEGLVENQELGLSYKRSRQRRFPRPAEWG